MSFVKKVKYIVVHCSDTYEKQDIGVDEIRSWHKAKGWKDVGYHFVIKKNGTLEVGRGLDVVGAHAYGINQVSVGVCWVGGKSEDGPVDDRTKEQKTSLLSLLKTLKQIFPKAEIIGHRDVSDKSCPNFNAKEEYAKL